MGKNRLEAFSDGVLAIPLAVWFAQIGYIAVALMWLIPDRRIEKTLSENSH